MLGQVLPQLAPEAEIHQEPSATLTDPQGKTNPPIGRRKPLEDGRAFTFLIEKPGDVDVIIYDVAGKPVRTLEYEDMDAGKHTIYWDGKNDLGEEVSAGVYFGAVNDYIIKIAHGTEGFTSIHDLINSGSTLYEALKAIGKLDIWNQIKDDPDLIACIEKQLRAHAPLDDAIEFCRVQRQLMVTPQLPKEAGLLSGNLVLFGIIGLGAYLLLKDKL